MNIQDIDTGTWFSVSSEAIKNSYKLIGECEPGIYTAELNNDLIEFPKNTLINKIDGFQLYLLQGGRDWD